MERWYGDSGVDAANRFIALELNFDELAAQYPLFEPLLIGQLGVVVHSSQACRSVRKSFDIPVRKLNLPFPSVNSMTARPAASDVFRMVTGGHGNPHTRLEELLRGWHRVSSPHRFRLTIFGRVAKLNPIVSLARELGLDQFIEISGFVSNEELSAMLDEAHLAVNLRNPTFGEASGGQLRYWDHCLPTLVSDAGWYAECPDESVIKISPANEIPEITNALESLLNSHDEFRLIGENGKKCLLEKHNVAQYTDALIEFAREVAEKRFFNEVFRKNVANKVAGLCSERNAVTLFKPAIGKLLKNTPYS
jgi:glycosyltransferase involved in cell wall biosynthesis